MINPESRTLDRTDSPETVRRTFNAIVPVEVGLEAVFDNETSPVLDVLGRLPVLPHVQMPRIRGN